MSALSPSVVELIAAGLFAIAILHTFSTSFFARLAHVHPRHAGLWHLLGEVEVVFGFWAFVLIAAIAVVESKDAAVAYLDSRDYTEPLFVFVIMVIAASRPVLDGVQQTVRRLAAMLPRNRNVAVFFLCVSVVPLLGSFITEPAAMTLAALMLRDAYFSRQLSARLLYATVGVLFVNVSIGGTLTHFAAPPVLMVAAKWQWDTWFMLSHFGWKAALAVFFNSTVLTWLFRKELASLAEADGTGTSMPSLSLPVTLIHLVFLSAVVFFSHHSAVFMGLFLFFLGFTEAYKTYQDRLILREGLLVAFFLTGLVTLGGLQRWWLEPFLSGVDETVLYFIATALTAVTDNAALTYLGSLVDGVSADFKYALVAGAVTGGGLTVIANAPNPAGFAILEDSFPNASISPLGLFLAALPATLVAVLAFQLL